MVRDDDFAMLFPQHFAGIRYVELDDAEDFHHVREKSQDMVNDVSGAAAFFRNASALQADHGNDDETQDQPADTEGGEAQACRDDPPEIVQGFHRRLQCHRVRSVVTDPSGLPDK